LTGTLYTKRRIGTLNLVGNVEKRPASTSLQERISGPGWLAVGDAASAYDPLTGAGVAKALHFAKLAADTIASTLEGSEKSLSEYGNAVKHDFSIYLAQRCAQYTREQRWSKSPFWKRRHEQLTTKN
jgi:flavin-dependent dehydrogenase